MHMLGSMTKEYAKLLTKLAVEQAPLQLGQELHVGQPLSLLQLPKPSMVCQITSMHKTLPQQHIT